MCCWDGNMMISQCLVEFCTELLVIIVSYSKQMYIMLIALIITTTATTAMYLERAVR